MGYNKGEFKYEILQPLGRLSADSSGNYTKEVNLIAYRDSDAVIDIRKWNRETDTMLKGITLSREEALKLKDILYEYLG